MWVRQPFQCSNNRSCFITTYSHYNGKVLLKTNGCCYFKKYRSFPLCLQWRGLQFPTSPYHSKDVGNSWIETNSIGEKIIGHYGDMWALGSTRFVAQTTKHYWVWYSPPKNRGYVLNLDLVSRVLAMMWWDDDDGDDDDGDDDDIHLFRSIYIDA